MRFFEYAKDGEDCVFEAYWTNDLYYTKRPTELEKFFAKLIYFVKKTKVYKNVNIRLNTEKGHE